MSDNEWSSDEENNEVPEQRELKMLESEEDSEYEEERLYIMSLMKKKEANFISNSVYMEKDKQKKEKTKKIQKKKEYFDIGPIDYNLPEKKSWVSSRMKARKEKDGKVTIEKRKFHPRLPLPTIKTFKKNEEVTKIKLTDNEFPSL